MIGLNYYQDDKHITLSHIQRRLEGMTNGTVSLSILLSSRLISSHLYPHFFLLISHECTGR